MDFLIHLDHVIFQFINQTLASPWQDFFFPAITDLHKQLAFKCIAYPLLMAFYFYRYKKMGFLYFLFCALTLSFTDWSGNVFIKQNVMRDRPFLVTEVHAIQRSPAHGFSFTSNHSSNMFAFATYCSAFFPEARFVFFGVAALIAYSRVYNGVHFPLDVICGALWGIAMALLFIRLARWSAQKLYIVRRAKESP
jgi:undecaprenyl-diphosphatase